MISAIAGCAEQRLQRKARRFLQGLSSDELQYIAEFLGACMLECSRHVPCSRRELADGISRFNGVRRAPPGGLSDQEHKMILLLEYLCRCRLTRYSLDGQTERAPN